MTFFVFVSLLPKANRKQLIKNVAGERPGTPPERSGWSWGSTPTKYGTASMSLSESVCQYRWGIDQSMIFERHKSTYGRSKVSDIAPICIVMAERFGSCVKCCHFIACTTLGRSYVSTSLKVDSPFCLCQRRV